ncbi:hypothetical protein BDFB_012375 [Asbolus verrucosus]|uniref:Uncharacterized protein n=1 Tax=Asbolus verrucosus TaxID=1661398 RepID=A0A482V8D0_ASBVE|nr:hypothetical protein BDFB_012375 [Asbolus verrucosus]
MEICRCAEYESIVENFKFFLVGTMHCLQEREKVPEGGCVKWIRNKTSYDDPRFTKPILIMRGKSGAAEDDVKSRVTSKWIPVLPGLISQKLVNQDRKLKMLLI